MIFTSHAVRLSDRTAGAFRRSIYREEAEAKANAHVLTGALRRSVHADFQGRLKARVGSKLPYAGIRDRGGIIRARRAKYLVFRTRDGRWHSVREVHQTGDRWLSRAAAKWPAFFVAELRRDG